MNKYIDKLNKDDIERALGLCACSLCVVGEDCPYKDRGDERWDCNEVLMLDAMYLIKNNVK